MRKQPLLQLDPDHETRNTAPAHVFTTRPLKTYFENMLSPGAKLTFPKSRAKPVYILKENYKTAAAVCENNHFLK